MGYLRKDMVMDAIGEDMETTLACYKDRASREIVEFCYECIEREIDALPQYRIDNVQEVSRYYEHTREYFGRNR